MRTRKLLVAVVMSEVKKDCRIFSSKGEMMDIVKIVSSKLDYQFKCINVEM